MTTLKKDVTCDCCQRVFQESAETVCFTCFIKKSIMKVEKPSKWANAKHFAWTALLLFPLFMTIGYIFSFKIQIASILLFWYGLFFENILNWCRSKF